MALFKKFILLPPLRSPESFYATYRGPWPFVKKWPLDYLQTTKKAPKSISVARTDGQTDSAITICLPKFLWGHKNISIDRQAIVKVGGFVGKAELLESLYISYLSY